MADYPGDLLSFEAVLNRAFLTASLPPFHDRVMIDPNAPSGIRVLAKSMHVLAAGWVASIVWLWLATLQQHVVRHGLAPAGYAFDTVVSGLIPAIVIALGGVLISRWAGGAPNKLRPPQRVVARLLVVVRAERAAARHRLGDAAGSALILTTPASRRSPHPLRHERRARSRSAACCRAASREP